MQVSLEQIALTEQQVEDLDLPRSPDDGESVELDALEALHPGMLEQLVRDAVRPYQDSALPHDLDSSRRAASDDATATWDEETADLRSELAQLTADAEDAAEPFRARLTALHDEFEEAIAPVRDRAEELQDELQGLADTFDPELPDRPEAEQPDVDDEVLFDSRRDWLMQLGRYKQDR